MKTIPELQKEVHAYAIAKGWYVREKSIAEHLCLIHLEVSEALEADRNGKERNGNADHVDNINDDNRFKQVYEHFIKGSLAEELADIIIRVMDLAEFKGIDLQSHIEAKMRYNSLRPHKHGGKKY